MPATRQRCGTPQKLSASETFGTDGLGSIPRLREFELAWIHACAPGPWHNLNTAWRWLAIDEARWGKGKQVGLPTGSVGDLRDRLQRWLPDKVREWIVEEAKPLRMPWHFERPRLPQARADAVTLLAKRPVATIAQTSRGNEMGAKTCLLAQAQGDARRTLAECPNIDASATTSFVTSLFPGVRFGTPRAADLSCTYLSDKSVIAGCFPGLRIVVAAEVAMDRPSELASRFIAEQGTTILHAMHSVVDWFAFAVWQDGVLIRSLSVAPDNGVIEDIGEQLAFEKPYWDGEHPAVDSEEEPNDYPLPFHPLELGEEALREFFGFQLEGVVDATLLEPERIPMLWFDGPGKASSPVTERGERAWWKFW